MWTRIEPGVSKRITPVRLASSGQEVVVEMGVMRGYERAG